MSLRYYDKIRHHIWFWLGYATYFYLFNKLSSDQVSIGVVLLSIPFFAMIFYTVSYFLDEYFSKKRFVIGLFALLLFYLFASALMYLFTYGWSNIGGMYESYLVEGYEFNQKEFIMNCLTLLGNFTFLAVFGFQYRIKNQAIQEKYEAVSHQLQEALRRKDYEFKILAAQASPHFIVNVFQDWQHKLNDTNLALSQEIGDTYELMRYFMNSLNPESSATILLQEEVLESKRYIAIQERMYYKALHVHWDIIGNLRNAVIPSTSLLTLIMNLFKHGDLTDPNFPAQVRIWIQEDHYGIQVKNKIPKKKNTLKCHGVGLENLRKRMLIVFGDDFNLNISSEPDVFEVELIVMTTNLVKS